MTGASPGARADHVACHPVNGVPGVCRRLTLAMRFCYTRRGFPTRSSSRSAFVSTTTAVFYLLAAFTVASALGRRARAQHRLLGVRADGHAPRRGGASSCCSAPTSSGVVQLLVYVGGILVLMLFAVMLTHRIADVQRLEPLRRARCRRWSLVGVVLVAMVRRRRCGPPGSATAPARRRPPPTASATPSSPTTCCRSRSRRSCCWRR